MKLPYNRWFSVVGGKTILKFGKHKGEYLEDLLGTEQGVWYLNMMLREFEDLPADIHAFIELAIEAGEDPLNVESGFEETPTKPVDRIEALKAKAKAKVTETKKAKEAEKTAEVLQQRKEESEW